MKRKRNQCWRNGCDENFVAQIRIKLDYGQVRHDWEFRGCKEHFIEAWIESDRGYKKMVEDFIETENLVLNP